MTYKEWFTATCSQFGLDATQIDVILLNQGITGTATVDVKAAKTALCKEFTMLIPIANVSEGGYSQSFNLEAVKLWYNMTCKELGLKESARPKIKIHNL